MPFTDEDLKRLKEEDRLAKTNGEVMDFGYRLVIDDLQDLIARLEAAEKVAAFGISLHTERGFCIPEKCEGIRDIEAWKQSCGE